MLIEGDVLITSGLTRAQAPSGITRILEANLNVIVSMHLAFAGLSVKYARSSDASAHSNRKNYFDEITLSLDGFCTLSQAEIRQMILLLSTCLRVSAARASAAFNDFTDGLPIRVRHVQGEQRI